MEVAVEALTTYLLQFRSIKVEKTAETGITATIC